MSTRNYVVYVLRSLAVGSHHAVYVGCTYNVEKRLRQHNGLIVGGARKTRFHRPWAVAALVRGFADRGAALRFEWALQHPYRSRALRGLAGRPRARHWDWYVDLAHEAIRTRRWGRRDLVVEVLAP